MSFAWIRNLTLLTAVISLAGMAAIDAGKDVTMASKAMTAGDADMALRLATRALIFGSLDNGAAATARCVRAEAAKRLGRPDFARNELNQVLRADPGNFPALTQRGDLLLADHNYFAALDDLNKAVELVEGNQDYPAVIAMRVGKRALARIGLKQYREAVADTKRVLQLKPGMPLGHYLRSLLLEASGKLDKSLESMELAYALKQREAGPFRLVELEDEGREWLGRLIELRMRNNVDPGRPFMKLQAAGRINEVNSREKK